MENDATRGTALASIFGSVFVRALALVALVAIVLTAVGIQSIRSAGAIGTEILAQNLTATSAFRTGGAIRFNKTDDLAVVLEETVGAANGMAIGGIVLNSNGEVVQSIASDAVDSAALAALATQAMSGGETVISGDRTLVAVPSRFGKENVVVGAVAFQWSPDALIGEFRKNILMALGASLAIVALAGVSLWFALSKPIARLTRSMEAMKKGDLDTAVEGTRGAGELGRMSRTLESLRESLAAAEKKHRTALIMGSGFSASSAAIALTDSDMTITYANPAFLKLVKARSQDIRRYQQAFDPNETTGISILGFHGSLAKALGDRNERTSWPRRINLQMGDSVMTMTASKIVEDDGTEAGFVIEWEDVTEQNKTNAILGALETKQIRVEFGQDWTVTFASENFLQCMGVDLSELIGRSFAEMFKPAEPNQPSVQMTAQSGEVAFAQLHYTSFDSECRIVEGSICPILDARGDLKSYILLGLDVTEKEARIAKGEADRALLEEAQLHVVTALRDGLSQLSSGNLTTRIDDAFSADHEQLRADFNDAVGRLGEAMATVAANSRTIRGEADNISSAAEDLSRRTERQAATLEETAAAIAELTASVASAAEGARQANDVVNEARDNAEQSGGVVREAVTAMGEIETSSDQISKIISVIDDIAFQTNLLALNAGVEAARAGDAGRGFAVVASEVRALAQRSSDAAREINELISTSGGHVKRGVELVGKAGDALGEIVSSVSNISGLVSTISASAQEQSTGLDEINTAMSQLDQVTQQNAAMFEETTAASQTLTREAETLAATMTLFQVDDTRLQKESQAATEPSRKIARSDPKIASDVENLFAQRAEETAPTRLAAPTIGTNALDISTRTGDDDWEDF